MCHALENDALPGVLSDREVVMVMESNLAMWSLIVGTVLPPIVAVVQQPRWLPWQRTLVMVVVSLVAGAGTAWFTGGLDAADWVTATLIVIVTAISTYKGIWTPTRVAPRIEAATSRGSTDE